MIAIPYGMLAGLNDQPCSPEGLSLPVKRQDMMFSQGRHGYGARMSGRYPANFLDLRRSGNCCVVGMQKVLVGWRAIQLRFARVE
ncbi:hypothetical protein [Rhizobium sp. BR 315]|uniref:hypothetical protein n=1 Tax=Rhizobium sp. BR 315 TaxID=3040014 RepID=UPI003D33A97C